MLTIETKHFAGGACLTGKGAGGKASLQELLEELQNPANATIGDGSAAAALTIDKDGAQAGDINLKSDGVLRGRVRLTSSETIVIEVFDASEVSQGSITIAANGAVTLTDGLTVSTGGLTVSAGGANITGTIKPNLPNYADNAAALAAGLVAGDMYRVGADPKIVV